MLRTATPKKTPRSHRNRLFWTGYRCTPVARHPCTFDEFPLVHYVFQTTGIAPPTIPVSLPRCAFGTARTPEPGQWLQCQANGSSVCRVLRQLRLNAVDLVHHVRVLHVAHVVHLRQRPGVSNSHGARPVHLIITMKTWIRTSRLSINSSLCEERVPKEPASG